MDYTGKREKDRCLLVNSHHGWGIQIEGEKDSQKPIERDREMPQTNGQTSKTTMNNAYFDVSLNDMSNINLDRLVIQVAKTRGISLYRLVDSTRVYASMASAEEALAKLNLRFETCRYRTSSNPISYRSDRLLTLDSAIALVENAGEKGKKLGIALRQNRSQLNRVLQEVTKTKGKAISDEIVTEPVTSPEKTMIENTPTTPSIVPPTPAPASTSSQPNFELEYRILQDMADRGVLSEEGVAKAYLDLYQRVSGRTVPFTHKPAQMSTSGESDIHLYSAAKLASLLGVHTFTIGKAVSDVSDIKGENIRYNVEYARGYWGDPNEGAESDRYKLTRKGALLVASHLVQKGRISQDTVDAWKATHS